MALPVLAANPEPLPPRYAAWLRQALGQLPGREARATCDNCVMCAPEMDQLPRVYRFDPATKCCTIVPNLPNFVVGGILADSSVSSAGRASVVERMARFSGVTPLGVAPPPIFDHTYEAFRKDAFGRSAELQCPHYLSDQGQCGIWLHRNGTCSTYFCRHNRGRFGRGMWDDLETALRAIERDLSFWCCQELGLDENQLRDLVAYRARPAIDLMTLEVRGAWASLYSGLWGRWEGREEAFYRAAAELVDRLSWNEVRAIIGAEAGIKMSVARASLERIPVDLPAAVQRPRPLQIVADGTSVLLLGLMPNDPVAVSPEARASLESFRYGPTEQLVARLGDDLVRRLIDVGVLQPAPVPDLR